VKTQTLTNFEKFFLGGVQTLIIENFLWLLGKPDFNMNETWFIIVNSKNLNFEIILSFFKIIG